MNEHNLELENRIKNLMWTVSGDYSLDVKPDLKSYRKNKHITLYDAVKQGAFAKYFDRDSFSLYLVKKIYLNAEEHSLMDIAQLCVDSACSRKVCRERAGVAQIREKSFDALLDKDFTRLSATAVGRIRLAYMREALGGSEAADRRTAEVIGQLKLLENTEDTMEIIKIVDRLYNQVIDRGFEKRYGGLDQVLAVTLEELKEFDWSDYLNENMLEDNLEQYTEAVSSAVTTMRSIEDIQRRRQEGAAKAIQVVDDAALKKMHSYVSLNYGQTYLTEQEEKSLNYKLCRGIHQDCKLYFTEGILKNPVKVNYQLKYAQKQRDKNKMEYHRRHRIVKRNIMILTETLRKAFVMRSEKEYIRADHGVIVPRLLWKVGRTRDDKLFLKEQKKDNSDFVVDILIDGSGSQSSRQSSVALQAYIISESLSNVGVPHRIMSFCTFWDYTILTRFREYEDGREANQRVFEYNATSNNRDGLAIKAASLQLYNRDEDNKIMILLSDGRPNDMILNRPGINNPQPYCDEYAVADTAFEVRRLRHNDISVLGVFAGQEQDLAAEKKIFGKDFAYIRTIENFSNIVSRYLRKQLEDM